MCVCTKYNNAFYKSVKLSSEQKALIEMSPSKPEKSAIEFLFNHRCNDEIIFIEELEIKGKIEYRLEKFIEVEKHKQQDRN